MVDPQFKNLFTDFIFGGINLLVDPPPRAFGKIIVYGYIT